MKEDERRLTNKIYFFEDMLLRCKDYREAEQIRYELVKMRRHLSKMRFNRMRNGS